MKMKKKILYCLGAVLFFLVLAYAFVPQVLSGKIVNQSDISGYVGMSHEMNTWNAAHPDDPTSWTDSMFGGMPTTTISAPRQGDWTQPIYDFLLTGRRPATYLFISLLGAFLLMLSLGVDGLLAVGGAIAVTFCSYNFQIIQVGHNTKMQAIAFMPWVLAALVYTYRTIERKKYFPKALLGAVLFAFALSFQIKANHQQITYYLALMVLLYAVVYLVWLLTSPERRPLLGRFFAASALLLVLGLAGIATNANKLVPIYKYTPHSMRGGSELAEAGDGAAGLEMDYATAWSYGWEELPNLLIPNFNGGSSAQEVGRDSETYQLLKDAGQQNLEQVRKNLPMYWGPQPFTAGPMYMGAITVFLFVLGLGLCRGKEKWWIVVCTVLAVLLGLGSHLIGFTKFWYDYVPFYNKFRTVSMALVVLQVSLPMLAFLALNRFVHEETDPQRLLRCEFVAFLVTGGFCFLCWLIPGIAGSFQGAADAGQPDVLREALAADRRTLLREDALRSLLLIFGAVALFHWGSRVPKDAKETFRTQPQARVARRRTAALGICVLILADLFMAGHRYLGADDFVSPRGFDAQFDKRPVDEAILADLDPSYRVLDLTVSVFNDSHPSYWHKNIGGYSPAKLRRYQDVIETYLTPEINALYRALNGAQTLGEFEAALPETPVLSALNCRYIIVGEDIAPAVNPAAFGTAWFTAGRPSYASPQEEFAALGAVAEQRIDAGGDEIKLVSYAPNELHYRIRTSQPRSAVFSEIYYPEGWVARLEDGSEVELYSVDWILRGADLPAGSHELVMRFEPKSVSGSAAVSRASSVLLILLLLGSAALVVLEERKKMQDGS